MMKNLVEILIITLNICLVLYVIMLLCSFYVFSVEYKIIIVGLDNAGKTTILYQL